jgi:hypothetical protein
LTAAESENLSRLIDFQRSHWPGFLDANFPGVTVSTEINNFDWLVIMLNQPDPELFSTAWNRFYAHQFRPKCFWTNFILKF